MIRDVLLISVSAFLGIVLLFWPVKFLRFFYRLNFMSFKTRGFDATSRQQQDYELLNTDPDLFQQTHRSLFVMLWITGALAMFFVVSYLCNLSGK